MRAPKHTRRAYLSSSEKETLDIASGLGACLRGGEILALVGELGSGKTTFTRGLARGLGILDTRLVSSPTYVLEQIYPARVPIHHYDAYRLATEAEFVQLGFEERIREGAVLVVEWAEKVTGVLPEEALRVELVAPVGGPANLREIHISGLASFWEGRLRPLRGSWGEDPRESPPAGRR